MKISLYQPCNDGTYHTIPDNMLVSNPEHFYPAADYEALEAEVARLRKMVEHGIGEQGMKNDISYPDER